MSAASRLSAVLLLLGPALQAGEGSLAERANDILTRHCHQCHGLAGSSKGGLSAILDREVLVARGLIVPGRPANSDLYRKVKGGEMPPPASKKPRPDADAVNVLRDWIAAGAPALPGAARSFISPGDIGRLIRDDVQSYPPRQRRFLRYVSFTHLHNAGRPAAEMQLTAPALAKLVNSLSWHARISQPTPIDPAKTLFRLDLRDYRWTARTWERIIAVYPYRLPADAVDRVSAEAIGTEVFLVRGDWLLATASNDKLYYDVLEMPASDRALERLLQVDVARNLQEETVFRAGFNGSGVSRNNRVIERHDALHGALWRSHDFNDNSGRQNIFENPLGPVAGRHSFRPAGGEIIFHLPNGMQGYMLVNSTGQRVEKAPVEIVSDPLRPDKQVHVGLSCMTCHGRGLIPKDDQVRAHVEKNAAAFPAAVVDAVRSLYPPAKRLRTLLDADTKRYLTALEAAGIPAEGPEPVSTLTLRYEGVVDLAGVAAEFGLRSDEFTRKLSSSPSLLRLFGALQARAGTVQRPLLEEQFPRLVSLAGRGDMSEKTVTVRKADGQASFEGHTDAVSSLALSPDGKLALSGSQDHTLRLWDMATGRLVRTFEGHDGAVNSVAFSPDGSRILSAADDRTVRLWDTTSGKELSRLRGHLDRVRAVVFAPNGKRAMSAGQDRTLRWWDLERGTEIRSFSGHRGAVLCVAISPDGKTALSGGIDGTLRLWDVATGQEKENRDAHRRGVLCVAFSPDGKQAASGGEDRVLRLWQVGGLRAVRSMTGHVNALLNVRFTEDGRQVQSASSQTNREDRFLRVWDISGEEIAGRDGNASVWCAVFTTDGKYALTGGTDRRLQRWSLQSSGR